MVLEEPLFKRIDAVFLPVKDLEKAIDWYVENLGLSLRFMQKGVASFNVSETPLTLLQYKYPGFTEPPSRNFEFKPRTEIFFNFYTSDIRAAHKRLRERGVKVGEIKNNDGLQEFDFYDPDGNHLSVVSWPD
jgi:catechol 2,3-dioxygenase-like lactoylglutathione lyase family enzyme